MDRSEILGVLGRVRLSDEELATVYADAADRVTDRDVRQQLERIEKEHVDNVGRLDELLRREGVPRPGAETSTQWAEDVQLMRRRIDEAHDTGELLRLLELAERGTDAQYHQALRLDLDAESRELLRQAADHEREHLRWLETHAGAREGRHVRWGRSGYGTGDQFGGGEASGAGFADAGPSYSGGEDDYNTGEE